ncbi:MAG: lysophospholipid acyltransferase family protein [Methylacidiphilales bacterium]|nr:lysophospholipid acyltransferase family protein [Candidatus Methylacidiphilales bacterium]
MIAANKNDILDSFLFVYFRYLTRRAFHTIAGRGFEHLRQLPDDRPVILFCNHTNWWDGLIIYLLSRKMPHKAVYCMMEEKQLKHYRFFTWLGAFSVDLSSPLRSAASLRYAQRLLQKNDTAIWLFPQGRLCRQNEPIETRPGTDYLAQNAPHALLVPVALRYDFFREDRPNSLIEVGRPFQAIDSSDGRIAQECNDAFARVTQAAQAQDLTGFELLFRPRLTINKRWQWVKLALTGRLHEFSPMN